MTHVIKFHSTYSFPLEEGSICKYITSRYDIIEENYGHVFQVIGDPVTGDNTEVTYTFATDSEAYKTHIHVV